MIWVSVLGIELRKLSTASENTSPFVLNPRLIANPTVIQKANRELFKALEAVKDKNAVIVSMKIDLLMTGMYTMIDFAKYTGKLHEIRVGIEKAGHLPIEGFTYKYEKVAPGKKDEWIFDVYFFEADPTDPFARSISNE